MSDWTTLVSPAITVAGLLIGYGKLSGDLTGRIKGQEDTLVRHENKLDEHDVKFEYQDRKMTSLEIQAAKSESWRDGFKAASDAVRTGGSYK